MLDIDYYEQEINKIVNNEGNCTKKQKDLTIKLKRELSKLISEAN